MRKSTSKIIASVSLSLDSFVNILCFTFEQIDLQSSSRETVRLAEELEALQSLRRDVGDGQQEEQQSSTDEDLKVGTVLFSHLETKPMAAFGLPSSSETDQLAAGEGGGLGRREGGV